MTARERVFAYQRRAPINVTWLAEQIDEHKQNVWNWIKGVRQPRDPQVWVRMADALQVQGMQSDQLADLAHELALDVLISADDPALKEKAAALIRQIRGKNAN